MGNIPEHSFEDESIRNEERSPRVSDVEFARGNIASHPSFSSGARSSIASSNISHYMDDEIPAFDDQENFGGNVAPDLENFQDFTAPEAEYPLSPLNHPIRPSLLDVEEDKIVHRDVYDP